MSTQQQRFHRSSKNLPYVIAAIILLGICLLFPLFAQARGELTITHVGPVSSDIIGITVTAGSIEHGTQSVYQKLDGDYLFPDENNPTASWIWRAGSIIGRVVGKNQNVLYAFDRFAGDTLDTAWADQPGSYTIKCTDDRNYSKGKQPLQVFRKSRPTDMGYVNFDYAVSMEHTLYLKLPAPLKAAMTYTVTFPDSTIPKFTFTYNPTAMRSEAVHVSQIGFRPDDPAKVAFVSLWMGSGGPKTFTENARFYVLENTRNRVVFQGTMRLSKSADDTNEDVYGRNYNGTNVYMMDFSTITTPGTYRVYVENVGCSYPFEINANVWKKAFSVSAKGLYHQRSGIELQTPFTTFYRPRNFHPDDGVKVYASTTPITETGNGFAGGDDNFTKLLAGLTTETVSNTWGGYADAGDWDRRTQHMDAARLLLELAHMFPTYFNTLDLNIPETGNGMPDVVNEALWGLDFFRRLQTADGSVRGGVESSGHPILGEASWQESQKVIAYAPDLWTTYVYAGVAARAASWLMSRNPSLAGTYWISSVRALLWAEWSYQQQAPTSHEIRDARNLAAAEYYRLSGETFAHEIFLATTAFKNAGAPLYLYNSHDQSDAAWVYYNTPGADAAIKENCKNAMIAEADTRLTSQNATAFKWTKDPWRPAFAGTFTTPDCIHVVRAHAITGEAKYLKAIVLATQTGAGANPLNMSYTTGVGQKTPKNVLHVDARMTNQAPPAGLTVLGPLDIKVFGWLWDDWNSGRFAYPDSNTWPVIESYRDVYWSPWTTEFTIQSTIAPNAYVWGYLAARGI
jgi:endoglucanase